MLMNRNGKSGQNAPTQSEEGGGNNGDAQGEEGESEISSEDIEMNLVKHLCSTTMDPATSLPHKN